MSHHDLPLLLAPQAEEDFADILQYTLETWGEAQMLVYRDMLDKALGSIRQNPLIGRKRQELSPSHRILPAEQHIIIYRVNERGIYVSRILHGRMDAARNL
jgi:toxin ParE1/3/4